LFLHCVVSHGYIALRLCGTVSHRGGNSNYGLLSESPGGSYSNTPFTVVVQTEEVPNYRKIPFSKNYKSSAFWIKDLIPVQW
jgi:hypothetical protein